MPKQSRLVEKLKNSPVFEPFKNRTQKCPENDRSKTGRSGIGSFNVQEILCFTCTIFHNKDCLELSKILAVHILSTFLFFCHPTGLPPVSEPQLWCLVIQLTCLALFEYLRALQAIVLKPEVVCGGIMTLGSSVPYSL
jgi:hypothetical protein